MKDWSVTCIRIECSALIPCNDTSSLQIPVTVDSERGRPAVLNNWVSASLLWKSLSWPNRPSQPAGAAAEAGIFYSGSLISANRLDCKMQISPIHQREFCSFAFKAGITGKQPVWRTIELVTCSVNFNRFSRQPLNNGCLHFHAPEVREDPVTCTKCIIVWHH